MSFWNRVVQGNVNRIQNEGAAAYAEGMARAAGCGAPGADSQAAMAVAQDMIAGIKALCSWVGSWF